MVMAHHAIVPHDWFDGARGSVDVFFVISGFLITSLVVNEFDQNGRVDLKRFYRRRAYRLLPAAMAAIIGFGIYATAYAYIRHDGPPWSTYKALFYAAIYVSNWVWAFGSQLPIQFIHLWTLAVEEQFYFIAPISLAIALPRASRKAIITTLFALCAAGIVWRAVLFAGDAHPFRLRFGLDTHADALLVGSVLGLVFASGMGGRLFDPSPLKRRVGTVMLLAISGMTFIDIHRWTAQELWAPSVWALMGLVAVWSVINQPDGWHVRVLEKPWIQRIGKVSYALYLWHLPVQIYSARLIGVETNLVVRTAIAWAISYALAELSWRVIEAPAQHLRQKREQRAIARVAPVVVVDD